MNLCFSRATYTVLMLALSLYNKIHAFLVILLLAIPIKIIRSIFCIVYGIGHCLGLPHDNFHIQNLFLAPFFGHHLVLRNQHIKLSNHALEAKFNMNDQKDHMGYV